MESIRLFSRSCSFFLASSFLFSSASSLRKSSSIACVSSICSLVYSWCSCNCCRSTFFSCQFFFFQYSFLSRCCSCCSRCFSFFFHLRNGSLQVLNRCIGNRHFLFCIKLVALYLLVFIAQVNQLLRFSSNTFAFLSTLFFESVQLVCSVLQALLLLHLPVDSVNSILSSIPFSCPSAFCKKSFRLVSLSFRYSSRCAARFFSFSLLRTFCSISLNACCILLQCFFFFNERKFFLFQCSFFVCNLCFQLYSFIGFCFLLFVQFLIGNIESFQCSFGQFNADFPVFFFYLVIFLRFFCLAFQGSLTGY